MIKDYLLKRENLMCLFVLADVRLEPQKIDLDFMHWVGESQLPFIIVFTKADKLSPPKVDQHVARYRKTMLKQWEAMPPYFISSAISNRGREEILDFIRNLNVQF
jgi:GTP-binding protein